jgi:L,D-transpeptidase catalytic domain
MSKKSKFGISLLFISLTTLCWAFFSLKASPEVKELNKVIHFDKAKTEQKANEALEYCKSKKMNTDFCILIDMSIHSGLNRFFVYDFIQKTITDSILVGHGCGYNNWGEDNSKENPTFSNEVDSHRSSLGKYKLGERAHSEWGINIKYVMHGLEKTNDNAQKRYVVFHSWEKVTEHEIYPKGTAEGYGCPTISNANLKKLDPKLKAAKNAVLLWIYK